MTTDMQFPDGADVAAALARPYVPAVRSRSWNASVCYRIVMEDGRIVYVHYGVSSFQGPTAPWQVETVTVHAPNGDQRERYQLTPEPWENRQPDAMPRWLMLLIQTTPEPRPITKD